MTASSKSAAPFRHRPPPDNPCRARATRRRSRGPPGWPRHTPRWPRRGGRLYRRARRADRRLAISSCPAWHRRRTAKSKTAGESIECAPAKACFTHCSCNLVYTLMEVEIPLVYGKLVKIQHSPATVSAEDRSRNATVPGRNGKADRFDDAQVRRPASGIMHDSALEGGARMRTYVSGLLACCLHFFRLPFRRNHEGQGYRSVRRAHSRRPGLSREPRRRRGASHRRAARGLSNWMPPNAPARTWWSPRPASARKSVAARGCSVTVQLEIAPQVDSVRVVGSAIDVPASEQGGSVT